MRRRQAKRGIEVVRILNQNLFEQWNRLRVLLANEETRRLVKDGYRVRIYIPYGKDWFPYFMRRLAERPANIGFLLRNFFQK